MESRIENTNNLPTTKKPKKNPSITSVAEITIKDI
jgi:hypothetical protein